MKEFLKTHDITPTTLRLEIIVLLTNAKAPVSYDELAKKVEANKSTIYRNLKLFEEKGIIISGENGGKNYYELADHAKAYFVCEKCHKMEAIEMPNLKVSHVKSVVVKGTCDECLG